VSDQVAVDPTIILTKSRRRIAFSKAQDCADLRGCNYTRDLRPTEWGVQGSSCTATILSRQCLLWVISGRAVQNGMSALPPKADICSAPADVCFVPEADSCNAANRAKFDDRGTQVWGAFC
jgi:hypothetical protein